MPLVMHLACILCKMNMEEAFNAATINSAYSIGLGSFQFFHGPFRLKISFRKYDWQYNCWKRCKLACFGCPQLEAYYLPARKSSKSNRA